MRKNNVWTVASYLLFSMSVAGWAGAKEDPDKVKALANPYANDLGPADVDTTGYPKDALAGYKLLKEKCTKCHEARRPLNAQFLELKTAEDVKAFKKLAGAAASDDKLYIVDAPGPDNNDNGVWKRYVKRMSSKPGCELKESNDRKAIYTFLLHDSQVRKTGANIEKWVKHRQDLLKQFKEKNPKRYTELYEGKKEEEKK